MLNIIKKNRILYFLYPFVARYKYIVVMILITTVVSAFLEGLSIGLLVPFLRSLSGISAETYDSSLMSYVNTFFLKFPEHDRILYISAFIFLAIILKNGIYYISKIFIAYLNTKLAFDIRSKLLSLFINVRLSFFMQHKAADLTDRINLQVHYCGTAVQNILLLISSAIVTLAYIFLMIFISFYITLIASAVIFGIFVFLRYLTSSVRRYGTQSADSIGAMSARIGEMIMGIATVKMFGREKYETNRASELLAIIRDSQYKSLNWEATIQPLSEIFITATILILIIASVFFISQPPDFALLITFLFLLSRLNSKASIISSLFAKTRSQLGYVDRVISIYQDMKSQIFHNGNYVVKKIDDSIIFDNITFYYPGSHQAVFEKSTFKMRKGEKIAIIGPSGSGKSTMINLLLRFYDPDKGSVFIDGKNLTDLEIASYRRRIAIVSQDIFLFHDTVRNNIAYGADNTSNEDIVVACKQAFAHDFIISLEHGYDTVIADRGMKLSGGQKQRIAIARAILKDPDILILDEATSGLDKQTEIQVQESLEKLAIDRTVIIITHRLKALKKVDKVYEIKDGKFILKG